MNLIDHALRYAANGFEVFPVSPADKAPLTTNGMKDATTDAAQVTAWWTATPLALIGCRIPADMMVVDIDPRHGGDATWRLLIDSYGPIAGGRRHRSGRGDDGFHQWLDRPEGKLSAKELHEWARRNNVGHAVGKRSWTSGIDILHHDHRYTILPPSPHPETGMPYEWITKGDAAPMAPWLVQYVVAKPPTSTTPPAARPVLRIADDSSIADWFSRSVSWNDILGPAGWLRVDSDGDSDGSKWRHPNASAKQSSSIRHGCLFVYSPNTDFDVTEDGDASGYTRFRAWAILEHGGDLSAAARAAREMRDGPSSFDVFGGAISAPMVTPAAVVSDDDAADDDWPAPIPVGASSELPPAFPVDVFPAWIAEHIVQVANELQVPVDLPAALAVVALAVCCAKRAELRVARVWIEPLCLYIVVGMPPGAGKSPAVRFMLGRLEAHERQLRDAAIPAISEAETKRAILDKAQRRAIEKGETAQALSIGDEMLMLRVPIEPRLFVDDVTIEKLSDLLNEQGGRLALVSTEGGLFDQMAGRYGDKGTKANLDPYLQMWSGDTVRVDRMGRGAVVVERPALTIGLTVQPAVLASLGDRPELRGRGLTARFMFALPPSNVGWRNMVIGDGDVDDIIADRYDDQMLALWRKLEGNGTNPVRLNLSVEARERFMNWRQALEVQRRPGGELAQLSEWSTKVESSVARLSGLLHLAHGFNADQVVSDATMAAAITVGEYWIAHAKAVYALWDIDKEAAAAGVVLGWLAEHGQGEVSVRDIYAAHRSLFPRATDVAAPLALLVERGWLRPLFDGPLVVGKRGVPSPRFAVHPRISSYIRNNHARMRELRVEIPKKDLSLSLSEYTGTEGAAHDAHARMTPEPQQPPTDPGESYAMVF